MMYLYLTRNEAGCDYVAESLDSVKPEHKRAVALLMATDPLPENYNGNSLSQMIAILPGVGKAYHYTDGDVTYILEV